MEEAPKIFGRVMRNSQERGWFLERGRTTVVVYQPWNSKKWAFSVSFKNGLGASFGGVDHELPEEAATAAEDVLRALFRETKDLVPPEER